MLHGSGRDGFSLIDKWKDLASKEGIIIVGPDANGEGWSTPRDGPAFLHDLVEELKSTYPINPRRVYLFGHSAGAVFALMMSTVDAMRERSAALLGAESFAVIEAKRDESQKRADKLHLEIDDLQKAIDKLMH